MVKNTVTITDSDGDPLSGNFSVAVTSDREVSPDTTSTILTQLLLTSDLRGYIENPAFYFQNTNTAAMALDLLMLTQGWRRYNLTNLKKGSYARPTMPIEAGSVITGTVKSVMLGKPVSDIDVTLLSQDGHTDVSKTDNNGRFTFDSNLPDSTRY